MILKLKSIARRTVLPRTLQTTPPTPLPPHRSSPSRARIQISSSRAPLRSSRGRVRIEQYKVNTASSDYSHFAINRHMIRISLLTFTSHRFTPIFVEPKHSVSTYQQTPHSRIILDYLVLYHCARTRFSMYVDYYRLFHY